MRNEQCDPDGLSARARHVMKWMNLKTAEDLSRRTMYDISRAKGVGHQTLIELSRFLVRNDLWWAQDPIREARHCTLCGAHVRYWNELWIGRGMERLELEREFASRFEGL